MTRHPLSFIVFLALLVWAGGVSQVQAADYWTCEGGKWVAVGKPHYPMPLKVCGSHVDLPRTQAACEQAGGRWGRAGLSPRPLCKMPTRDGGRPCGDVGECEGYCIAAPTAEQQQRISRQRQKLPILGKCAAYVPVFGCMYLVRKGEVAGRLCAD